MDIDDNFGPLQLFFQLLISLFKSRVFNRERIRLWTTLAGFKGVWIARGHLLSPIGQVGRIEPFTAQQGTYLTWILAGGHLLQDSSLVLGGKPASFRFGPHFGIRSGSGLILLRLVEIAHCHTLLPSPCTLNYLGKVSQWILAHRAWRLWRSGFLLPAAAHWQ